MAELKMVNLDEVLNLLRDGLRELEELRVKDQIARAERADVVARYEGVIQKANAAIKETSDLRLVNQHLLQTVNDQDKWISDLTGAIGEMSRVANNRPCRPRIR
jgi:hypothetical protein